MSTNFSFTRPEGQYNASLEETHSFSEKMISIAGRNYKILGSEKDIAFLRSQLSNVNDFKSMEHLEATLSCAGPYVKTESIFCRTLSPVQTTDTLIRTEKGNAIHMLLEEWAEEHDFAGAVMVVDQGVAILKQGYGNAKENDTQPISPNMRLPIGSLTKPITCDAILNLVQEKKFNSQTNPAEIKALQFLPEDFLKHMDQEVLQRLEDVTLLDLMNHTSGLPSYPNKQNEIDKAKENAERNPLSPEEFIALVRSSDITDKGIYNYSNFGYILLGKIIEQVSGQTYDSYMHDFLNKELEAKETGYVGEDVTQYPTPKLWDNEKGEFVFAQDSLGTPSEAYSAGALYSTVEDLTKMSSKQATWSEQEGAKVIKEKEERDFRQEYTCTKGWNISKSNWRDTQGNLLQEVWKTGAVEGFGGLIVLYPNQKSSIVVLSNQPHDIEKITTQISHALCLPEHSKDDTWTGVYRIPEWDETTFSIAKTDKGFVFRTTHPEMVEINLTNTKEQTSFFPFGPNGEPHYIKQENSEFVLYGPQDERMDVKVKKTR